MPKVILHVGMPKTGTTALQNTLDANKDSLLKKGVLYPTYGLSKQDFLVPLLYKSQPFNLVARTALKAQDKSERRRAMREMKQDPAKREAIRKRVDETAEQNWQDIVAKSKANDVKRVVLSEEVLGNGNAPDDAETVENIRGIMAQLSDDITIVAYLRNPASRFLSGAGQKLKTGQLLPRAGLNTYNYRPAIENLENLGIGQIKLNDFDRDALIDNDITADFQAKYIPEFKGKLETPADAVVNENISAEAMVLFQKLLVHVSSTDEKTSKMQLLRAIGPARAKKLQREMYKLDREVGGFSKPKLRPEAADLILSMQADDLHWMKEKYSVSFADIDYDTLKQAQDPDTTILENVSTFSFVDEARLEELNARLNEAMPEAQKLMEKKPGGGKGGRRRRGGGRRNKAGRRKFA